MIKTNRVDSFTEDLNSHHPSIKFTRELEENSSIAVLDSLLTRKPDGSIKSQVYRKPTHTDQYLQFNSHQPLQHKLGIVRTLTHRARTLTSEDEDLQSEMDHLKKVLSISGYSKWSWDTPASRKSNPHPSKNSSRKTVGHVTLPYVGGISETLSRKMQAAGISVHFRPNNTLKQNLVSLKDKKSRKQMWCSI